MKRANLRLAALCAGIFAATTGAHGQSATSVYLETPRGQKPRVVITADPELDDSNSLIRYLLYVTDFRTEGLIYASSQFHWMGDGKGTRLSVPRREYNRVGPDLCPCTSWRWAPSERFIGDAVEAYSKSYANLRVHHPDYPTPELLQSKIRWGNVQFDGEMEHDTPGSDLIKSLILDDEEAPIYLHAWGGQSTIARALKSIEDEYRSSPQWTAIRAKVIRKAVIHASGDQDDTYAKYIKPNWPEIRYRQLTGGLPLAYGAQATVSEADAAYFTAAWMKENVSERGPLGAMVRVWGDGKQMVDGDRFDYFGIADRSADKLKKEGYVVWLPPFGKGEFLGEGDTFTFVNLLDNGLRGYRGDSLGGWGGYVPKTPIKDPFAEFLAGSAGNGAAFPAMSGPPAISRAPTHPFLAAAQRDWAARLKWSVTPGFAGANHNPKIRLAGSNAINAKAGEHLRLGVQVSDPDGDRVSLKWWNWEDVGTYRGAVNLKSGGHRTSLVVPKNAKPGDTIQVIAEATDSGKPALTSYKKVIINVTR